MGGGEGGGRLEGDEGSHDGSSLPAAAAADSRARAKHTGGRASSDSTLSFCEWRNLSVKKLKKHDERYSILGNSFDACRCRAGVTRLWVLTWHGPRAVCSVVAVHIRNSYV
jgi:hypothetical protein